MSTTVSGSPRVGRPPSRWARIRSSPHRTRWLNAGLAVLLLGTAVGAFLLIGNPGAPQQVERTAVVTRGSVTAAVSGSGNAASQVSTPISFESSGVVKEVDVKPGDPVTLGQVLATIDPDSAQAGLRTAQAQLDGAKAALAQAQAGPTDVKAQQDALAVTSAQQALDTAQKQLDQAKQQQGIDASTDADAVSAAQKKLSNDQRSTDITVNSACSGKTTTSAAPTVLGNDDSSDAGNSSDCKSAKAAQKTTLDADRAALTAAQNSQKNTALADQKAITSAEAAVTTATNNVSSAKLAQQADQHPQTPAQIAQVQATVDSARVAVDTAQRGVDDTTLKAPQAGVVLAVNGKVGESSSGTVSASGTASGTSTTTTSGGTSSTSSSASSSASSAGSGFVVIANLSQLAITANIAESDASKVKLGQPAQITFPGTSSTATGSVVQITPQSTVTNNVVLYPITVAVDSAPPGVGVGATASLSIRTDAKDSVLRVPTAAITTQGDRHTVTVRKGGADSVVPVQIGVQGDTDTEILSGVVEGDTIVLPSATAPASNGVPGAPARVGG